MSDNSYNIQKSSYIYVYLTDISKESVAIININNTKNNSYSIDTDSISLDSLNIQIKDENGNIIDFCNLSFKLEFKIYFSNDELKIEETPNIDNVLESDSSEENNSINSIDIPDNVVESIY